jgi:hypothetical protein
MPASSDSDRYKRAADAALKVLDWCIWYFRYEGQGEIAKRLEQNRDYIRKLLGEAEEARAAAKKPAQKLLKAIGLS